MGQFTNTTQRIPIEDHFGDVIAKAQSGLGLASQDIAKQAGIDGELPRKWRKGQFDESEAQALEAAARALGLAPDKLLALARMSWYPDTKPPNGLAAFNTPFGEYMSVNAYIAFDPDTREATIFDTGTDAAPVLDFIKAQSLKVSAVFITHGHRDHIAGLEKLRSAVDAPAYAHPEENVTGTEPIVIDYNYKIGSLVITCHATPGHSPGGTTFCINGMDTPIGIVGDALFAGSVGGIRGEYHPALRIIREKILSLPPETIVCPGHGPLATVASELVNNPFFQ